MVCSQTCAINSTYVPSKMETFVTKVPHEITLTDAESRIFIKNIKSGVTLEQFRHSLEEYGPVQIYLYEPGTQNDGWAWVAFENKEAALKVIEESEKINEENNENEASVHSNDEEKQDSNSFYAENEDNQQNDEEEEENDD
ncbi:conserved Plasmodium protein, unknown function [Plasmodium relictum]|uniref:RRM domain-containing protein n=1 Tax=Plasmodium relictum TaxID=85471 RepID=A0A1J1HEQ8_PLARL|nr:conserved Plasmodium protein, unknown function [Plasmodium relictum]CRH02356.1 conserved Plasmodium protein, unknown function [Plasmodium relictum]